VDHSLATQEICPLKNNECPLAEELRQVKEECRRLQKLSRTDVLTSLYNLRYLTKALSGEMERTRRTGLPTSLIMVDLDHFKHINDTYGHEAGNKMLRHASDIWRDSIRRIDVLCRYGGEEFALILPGTILPGAIQVAERLRKALAGASAELNNEPVTVTASFGVDIYTGKKQLSVKAFIDQTDRYLLEAKSKGRNCTCSKTTFAPTEVTVKEREALVINRTERQS
jgi:two-component system cell cycle response regulator